MIDNKKGVSPLIATILLIIVSLVLGTITMNIGKAYIEEIAGVEEQKEVSGDGSLKYIGDSLYRCTDLNPETKTCSSWELVKD